MNLILSWCALCAVQVVGEPGESTRTFETTMPIVVGKDAATGEVRDLPVQVAQSTPQVSVGGTVKGDELAPAEEPLLIPIAPSYRVLRDARQVHQSAGQRPRFQSTPTVLEPRRRQPYAYGWFGVQSRGHGQSVRNYDQTRTRWIWK